MCGIVHVKRKTGTPAKNSVIKRYKKQKSRGSEGFGFVQIIDGKVKLGGRAEDEKEILEMLEKSDASEILFHHRTPTSTPNIVEATHPIIVKNKKLKYNYYVVHNGIIYNDIELRDEHIKEGFKYTTDIEKKYITRGQVYTENMFNDSEAVAIDFVKCIESGEEMKARGSMALIALQFEKTTKKAIALFFARNVDNPLCIEKHPDFMAITSENGKSIMPNCLYRLDYETDLISEKYMRIGFLNYVTGGYYNSNTGNYVHGTSSQYGLRDDDDYGQGAWDSDGYARPIKSQDELQDEFRYAWDDMMQDLRDKIAEAKKAENWDEVNELEEEYQDAQDDYLEMKADALRSGKLRRMGFN